MRRILIATSNPGKLRDFAGAARAARNRDCQHSGFRFPAHRGRGRPHLRSECAQESRRIQPARAGRDRRRRRLRTGSGCAEWRAGRAFCALCRADSASPLADENTDDDANNARVLRELREVPRGKAHREICLRAGRGARRRRLWRLFAGRPKELFSKLRAARMASDTIRCFIFRRFRKRLRNSARKRKPIQPPRRGVSGVSGMVR